MEKNTQYLRMAICVNKSLCMPTGKLAAMVAHAAMTFMLRRLKNRPFHRPALPIGPRKFQPSWTVEELTDEQIQWLTELDPGLDNQVSMAKIVLAVNNEQELLDIEQKAKDAKLECHRVVDCGYSHNKPGDLVCIAIGPDWPDKLHPVTGHLKVYR